VTLPGGGVDTIGGKKGCSYWVSTVGGVIIAKGGGKGGLDKRREFAGKGK